MSKFQPNLDILPDPQRRLWPKLSDTPDDFVLYGGTAIALYLGHRESIDFDFFSSAPFEPGELIASTRYLQQSERLQSAKNTLVVLIKNSSGSVKLSFFGDLDFGRVQSPLSSNSNNIRIASLLDLAASKIKVLQDRAELKDYFDIYTLLQHGISLDEALSAAMGVYGKAFNPVISLKALTYFDDGDVSKLTMTQKSFLTGSVNSIDLNTLKPILLENTDISAN